MTLIRCPVYSSIISIKYLWGYVTSVVLSCHKTHENKTNQTTKRNKTHQVHLFLGLPEFLSRCHRQQRPWHLAQSRPGTHCHESEKKKKYMYFIKRIIFPRISRRPRVIWVWELKLVMVEKQNILVLSLPDGWIIVYPVIAGSGPVCTKALSLNLWLKEAWFGRITSSFWLY